MCFWNKKGFLAVLVSAGLVLGLAGCGKEEGRTIVEESTEQAADTDGSVEEPGSSEEDAEDTIEEESAEAAEEAAEERVDKQVIVYFANWNLNEKDAVEGGEVASIPWDSVTFINHAFWAVVPADGSTETSFERRDKGEEARTEFAIASTSPETDYQDTNPSAIDSSMERNHFAQYAAFSEQYPDVNIMISIGGWSACGYFSEMAYTREGREGFIKSCLELMEEYPWIDGIDLDWEYPGGSNDGERLSEGEGDQGCPIWGTQKEDAENFAALVKEMREAFDEKYGEGGKKITACASASTGWTLPNQDWVAAEPYLDYINIMTYDLAGDWDGATGHASGISGVKGAMSYFMGKNIPNSKLNIGSPMYGTGFMMGGQINPDRIVGAPIVTSTIYNDNLTVEAVQAFEAEAVSGYDIVLEDGKPVVGEYWDNSEDGTVSGWHFAYDTKAAGPYLYNDDENSEYYKWYISYENPVSLQEKLDLIEHYNLAGIIVWECSEDSVDHQLIRQMGDFLLGE